MGRPPTFSRLDRDKRYGGTAEVLERAAKSAGVTYAQAAFLFTHILESLVDVTCERRNLQIPGLGQFFIVAQRARGSGRGRRVSRLKFVPFQSLVSEVEARVCPDDLNLRAYTDARSNAGKASPKGVTTSGVLHRARLRIIQDAEGEMQSYLLPPTGKVPK